ncbi:MAG TPA: hypothetical protein VMZ33_07315 [Candidatus Limnocylindrales bacterium]|nr:hypothetical protein [Candidatus Limnocylindrales bacterium]
MAQYALPPGAIKRRTAFGLLDADGWGWATVKALFWFFLVIFLLGYVPDRAYYFTVSPTIDLGFNVISPINLCPAENKTLPCPAPAGAVIPWEQSPDNLSLPQGRAAAGVFTSGETIYLIGGRTDAGATTSVLTADVFEGNLTQWAEGPALPEPRSDAAVASVSGVPYVIGGLDASGAPSTTVFQGVVESGQLTGWEVATAAALPAGVSDSAAVGTGTSLFLFGGRTAEGLSATVWRAHLNDAGTELEAWAPVTELPLPEARADHTALSAAGAVYIVGGEGPSGTASSVFYLALDSHGEPTIDHDSGRVFGWGVSAGSSAAAALPEPRRGQTSFTNSGTIFALGGYDANNALAATNLWTVPSATNGTIRAWSQRDETNLLAPRAEAAAALVGQHVFVIGGVGEGGALQTSSFRADVAPRPAFFRLGLFGLTVPALSIKGEIGQQLGYIIAGSAALGNFVLLVVIGWMYSHRRETMRFFQWISRGRLRAPREDEYQT